MYDYLIIGSGVIGCFIAQKLSEYEVSVLVLDKENDIGNATTAANSAIIHSGYDPKPGSLKAKLNVIGNKMYPEICKKYNVPFKKTGSLTVAFDDEGLTKLNELYEQAKINGVEVELIDSKRVLAMEPNIRKDVKMALYAPSAGIVYPWQISYALMDHSISNGVTLELNQEVIDIQKIEDYFLIKTKNNEYKSKNIINCAGVHGAQIQQMLESTTNEIRPRKGEYYVLARGAFEYLNHIIFPIPSEKGKGVLATPISEREILIGPTSEFVDDFDDVSTTKMSLKYLKDEIGHTMENVPLDRIMRSFSGLRATSDKRDFIIEKSNKNDGFYNIIGIESPGLASAPAIAMYFAKIANLDNLVKKSNYKKYQATTRVVHLEKEERQRLIKENPDYGQIVCRCEEISLQEIKEAIKGNVGASSIKGIKKRVRPGSGKCQGGFCEPEIVKIISQEKGINQLDVVYDSLNSQVLIGESKEDFKNE